jgi:hypothetical protein
MTQEEKELLLKDLCGRLPYGVKCHFKYGTAEDDVTLSCIDNGVARFEYGWYGRFHVSIDADYIKPYLRPMSSMTEEELGELLDNEDIDFDSKSELVKRAMLAYAEEDKLLSNALFSMQYAKTVDWLNAHHFDYRGLIKKGLALEAPKDMYK